MADTVPIPAGVTAAAQATTVPIPSGVQPGRYPLAAEGQVTGLGANTGTRSDDPVGRAIDTGVDYLGGAVAGAGKSLLKGAGGLTELAGEAINKIPGVGETLAPRAGLEAEKKGLASATADTGLPGEKAGGVIEEGAEWLAGDAALTKFAKIAKFAPALLKIIDKYPTAAKVILGAGKGAAIGGTQAGTKAAGEGKELKDVKEAAVGGAEGGAVGGAAGEVLDTALSSKVARGAVNRSVGAGARDITYGNPGKALLDEKIISPVTGDIEAYKSAMRTGKTEAEAAQAAGGRIASVSQKINEVEPQLTQALKSSKARIPVKDAILDPIYEATSEIINNRAMDEGMKDAAIDKILGLQKSLVEGLGKDLSPSEANEIKRQIGDRVNWGGTAAVGDEVKAVYKKLYGSLKNAVHDAVPEAAEADERLTNLLAARKDILNLSKREEAGIGTVAGNFKEGVLGRIEALIGRIIPGAAAAAKSPVTKAAAGRAGVVLFTDSQGGMHSVPADKLDDARKIDPDLKVIQQQ